MAATDTTRITEVHSLDISADEVERLLQAMAHVQQPEQALADVIDIDAYRAPQQARGPFAMPVAS